MNALTLVSTGQKEGAYSVRMEGGEEEMDERRW